MSVNFKLSSLLAGLVLLSIALIGSLTYSTWRVNSLEGKLEALSNIVIQNNGNEEFISLKRFSRQAPGSGDSSPDTLPSIVQTLIHNELYTILDCNRDIESLTDCILKTGPKGEKGSIGQQGEVGPKGDKGVVGARGDRGLIGGQGPAGDQGPKGDKGSVGARGDRGPIGPQGSVGYRGPKGDTGDMGPKGVAGSAGPKGEPGMQGFRGLKGAKGEKGDQLGSAGTDKTTTYAPPTLPSGTCGGPGWRRVAFINMSDQSQRCPQGLSLTNFSESIQYCARENYFSTITFPTGSSQYIQVCGRVIAYRF